MSFLPTTEAHLSRVQPVVNGSVSVIESSIIIPMIAIIISAEVRSE